MKAPGPSGLRWLTSIVALATLVAACTTGSTVETSTTVTTRAPVEVTTTSEVPQLDPFRIGLVGNITTDNWFAALDSERAPQNQAYLTNSKTSLFTLSLPGFAITPAMAATDSPVEPIQQGDVWVVEQPIRRGRTWSDGEPITAHDLAFYFETVREFDLGEDHVRSFPPEVESVTAVDDYTVRVVFSERPGLTLWNAAVALAPWVPAHWWQEHVDEAREAAETAAAAMTPDDARAAIVRAARDDEDSDVDITETDVTPEQVDEYITEVGEAEGRAVLYQISGIGEPSAGPVLLERWEQGEFVVAVSNTNYFQSGIEKTIYSDGSVRIADSIRGTDEVYGGQASGDVIAHYVEGPFVSEILWVEHGSREEAYEALARGEVDFVLDSSGMTVELRDELASTTDLQFSVSATEGFRYLAFNLRKPPLSDIAFRQATATLIDKEFIAEDILDGAVAPAYTVVHPDLPGHHNDEVERPGWANGQPAKDGTRLEMALQVLEEAGYAWEVEPVVEVDDEGVLIGVTPGVGLTMPNGAAVPELSILAPGPDYDPFRNTFSVEIAAALQRLGIDVIVEEREFEAIVEAVFPPQTPESALAWDMYVLGWGAADPVIPGTSLRAFFHSDQDAVLGGGFNTAGFISAEFDEVANAFDSATSIGDAARLTRQMEQVLARDLPYVVLFRTRIIEAFGEDTRFPTASIMGGHQGHPKAWPGSVRVDE
jgi:peptide/nickel transport system substrate-binding protein